MAFVARQLLLLLAFVSGSALLLESSASAQTGTTISLATAISRTKGEFRPNGQLPKAISYSDCQNDIGLKFTVNFSPATVPTDPLEVWVGPAGSDCTIEEERTGSSPDCWIVFRQTPTTSSVDVNVRAQPIIFGINNKRGDALAATSADCINTIGSAPPNAITLHFMLMRSNKSQATPVTFDTHYDVERPPPPTEVTAGIGENHVVLNWKAANAADRAGYRFYCDPKPGTQSTSQPQLLDAGGDAGGSAGTGTDDSGIGGSGADGPTGAGGSSGASGSNGAGGSIGEVPEPNDECPSTALTTAPPPKENECGSKTGELSTSGETKTLTNGVKYAVAVATTDEVGNVGPLSEIVCGTPQPVTDFYEAYRNAGGQAGGGFCSVGHGQRAFASLFVIGALAMLLWRRRAP